MFSASGNERTVSHMTEDTDDPPIRGEIRLAKLRRVSSWPRRGEEARTQRGRRVAPRPDGPIWLVCRPAAAFTHLTGARLLGWQLPKVPEQVPVFAAVTGDAARPRRHGLICSRLVDVRRPATAHMASRWTAPEEILLRAARDLSLLDLMILRRRPRSTWATLTAPAMEAVLASRSARRPHASRGMAPIDRDEPTQAARRVLQPFHRVMEVPVRPQFEVVRRRRSADRRSQTCCVARHQPPSTSTTVTHHRRGSAAGRPASRARAAPAGRRTSGKGFALDDLLNHPAGRDARDRQRASVDRMTSAGCEAMAEGWSENSLYSDAGRARVMNRWRRSAAVHDWSGPHEAAPHSCGW